MKSEDDERIRFAIANKRLLRLTLRGLTRLVEPHDYGLKKGVPQLLAFQVGGMSNSGGLPNWRWILLGQTTDVVVLEDTFAGGRGASSRKHSDWDELYARVDDPPRLRLIYSRAAESERTRGR
ncbi:MAG TPA: hypothetical protein VH062_21395 [Polyangiaceae bacterium]|jgi:hypothetical protein|nr:hypothetical protein [Polyangiaceae bacterium]